MASSSNELVIIEPCLNCAPPPSSSTLFQFNSIDVDKLTNWENLKHFGIISTIECKVSKSIVFSTIPITSSNCISKHFGSIFNLDLIWKSEKIKPQA
ncbi:hypothetical protein BLOT_010117 [Blomia tropicalis]|nr:hypothetical protein BLOT_010117 [Blomia tropicalis]